IEWNPVALRPLRARWNTAPTGFVIGDSRKEPPAARLSPVLSLPAEPVGGHDFPFAQLGKRGQPTAWPGPAHAGAPPRGPARSQDHFQIASRSAAHTRW